MKKLTLIMLSLVFFAACAGNPNMKSINAQAMPAEGTFDGVYHSPGFGRMEFTVNGNNVVGLFQDERFRGKIEGVAEGNVLNFTWTQYNEDLNGKVRESKGRGYFVYIIEKEGTAENPRYTHKLDGEWGYDNENAAANWDAVKFPAKTKKILKADGSTSRQEEQAGGGNPLLGGSSGSGSSAPATSSGGLDDASTDEPAEPSAPQGGGIADDLF